MVISEQDILNLKKKKNKFLILLIILGSISLILLLISFLVLLKKSLIGSFVLTFLSIIVIVDYIYIYLKEIKLINSRIKTYSEALISSRQVICYFIYEKNDTITKDSLLYKECIFYLNNNELIFYLENDMDFKFIPQKEYRLFIYKNIIVGAFPC